MAEIKIEKGIPIPEKTGGTPKYPWEDMEVGDSFLIEDGKIATVRSSVSMRSRRGNKKFTSRMVADGSVRVWRIK